MPSTFLWGIYVDGTPHKLSPFGNDLKWIPAKGKCRFLKINAGGNVAWGVGEDFRPYLHVVSSDVPVIAADETYENQRWLPFVRWSSKLLPTDRENWSDVDGNGYLPREAMNIPPSAAWEWEGPWTVDTGVDGLNPDKEGWYYAFNFPGDFLPIYCSNSFVRRRRWFRNRRYCATDQWIRVRLPGQYPVMDVAIGGHELPGQKDGFLSVWILTSNGYVLYRNGIHRLNPEGDYWVLLDNPSDCEFNQISCNYETGELFAVSWDGRLFRRDSIAKDNPSGTGWSELTRPHSRRLISCALGTAGVWAVSIDGSLWFNNLSNVEALSDSDAEGGSDSKWVEMSHGLRMSSVSVGGVDEHVFGIGLSNGKIYYRTGICSAEPSGREWKQLLVSNIEMAPPDTPEDDTPSEISKNLNDSRLTTLVSSLISHHHENLRKVGDLTNHMVGVVSDSASRIGSRLGMITRTASSVVRRESQMRRQLLVDSQLNSLANESEKSQCLEPNGDVVESDFDGSESIANSPQSKVKKGDKFLAGFSSPVKNSPSSGGVVQSYSFQMLAKAAEEADGEFDDEGFGKLCLESPGSAENGGVPGGHGGGGEVRPDEEDVELIVEDDDDGNSTCYSEDESEGSSYAAGAEVEPWRRGGTEDPAGGRGDHSGRLSWLAVSAGQLTGLGDVPKGWFTTDATTGYDIDLDRKSVWHVSIASKLQELRSIAEKFDDYEMAIEKSEWNKVGSAQFWITDGHNHKRTSHPCWTKVRLELYQKSTSSLVAPPLRRLSITSTAQIANVPDMPNGSTSSPSLASSDQILPKTSGTIVFSVPESSLHRTDSEVRTFANSDWKESCQSAEIKLKTAFKTSWHFVFYFPDVINQSAIDLPVTEISHIRTHSEDGKYMIFIYLCRHSDSFANLVHAEGPLRILFSAESDQLSWAQSIHKLASFKSTSSLCSTGPFARSQAVIPGCPSAFWALSDAGQPFCSSFDANLELSPTFLCPNLKLFPDLGHFHSIRSGTGGIVWALGVDGSCWASQLWDIAENAGKFAQTDVTYECTYENQRWSTLRGFVAFGQMFGNIFHPWSDETGTLPRVKDSFKLSNSNWCWVSDWKVDHSGETDSEGWQYSKAMRGSYSAKKLRSSNFRRRRWVRKCRYSTASAWQSVDGPPLRSLAISKCNFACTQKVEGPECCLLAVTSSGDLLYRRNVTQTNPCGSSWAHISSDVALQTIDIGWSGNVWAVGANGRMYYRPGISRPPVTPLTLSPTGDGKSAIFAADGSWSLIDAINPIIIPLFTKTAVGRYSVWAVDAQQRLLFRLGINDLSKTGYDWTTVSKGVLEISMSPNDELWAILSDEEALFSPTNFISENQQQRSRKKGHKSDGCYSRKGILAFRAGRSYLTPAGTHWESIPGDGWTSVAAGSVGCNPAAKYYVQRGLGTFVKC